MSRDTYTNKTGLAYFWDRIKSIFATKTELSTLSSRVDEIVADGGEPNVINTVKVNGVALTPDAQKAVDVTVPTATSDLTNDGDGASSFATEAYVDENGGKIDVIKVNGTAQTIENKTVNLDVPRVTVGDGTDNKVARVIVNTSNHEGITFDRDENGLVYQMTGTGSVALAGKAYADATFRTEAQVQQAIDDALADVTGIDFQAVDALPATGEKGVIYLVKNAATQPNAHDEYIWVTPAGGTAFFEKIGTTEVDLSGYWSKTELTAITTAEIDTIIDG